MQGNTITLKFPKSPTILDKRVYVVLTIWIAANQQEKLTIRKVSEEDDFNLSNHRVATIYQEKLRFYRLKLPANLCVHRTDWNLWLFNSLLSAAVILAILQH